MDLIDTAYDMRTDAKGKDPDADSKTLKNYHQLLWSKKLPNGKMFTLHEEEGKGYLIHRSELGEFSLSSDSVVHTYYKWKRMQHIIKDIQEVEMIDFYKFVHTIGGYLVFPANKINGKNTINQERGMNNKINDRIDLTLECIRLFYDNEPSPLFETLNRYREFFNLFIDFKGYVDFFLLTDLVSYDYASVNFFLPFNEFKYNPLPLNTIEYKTYMKNNINFIIKRNKRIDVIFSS